MGNLITKSVKCIHSATKSITKLKDVSEELLKIDGSGCNAIAICLRAQLPGVASIFSNVRLEEAEHTYPTLPGRKKNKRGGPVLFL